MNTRCEKYESQKEKNNMKQESNAVEQGVTH